ncbi:helix-turn-helix domain-containing protein [Lactiplantibacillus argentoratensis]|nr:helix-turn-helix domain-containing protein [Lactiplantibacillus pentosus]
MNLGEACQYLNVKSRNTLNKYIKQGLPVIIINGTRRIDKADADKFMEAHKI